ncbi:MAG: calcium/proton exchanger [Acidobacteria bacterium]|nr:calcium/proton exchanger [Acidobacteriota bacterium]
MKSLLKPSLDWFLVCIPATLVAEWTHASPTLIFFLACLSILPLAGWMGTATEHVAKHTGEGVGGLLNATFGNAAELIIALAALRDGLTSVVKASLTGSIIGNILLVLGASILGGGLKYKQQSFNAVGARVQSTLLTLAAVGLVAPAAFHHLGGPNAVAAEKDLSLEISVVLLVAYGLSLLFSLHTHKALFEGGGHGHGDDDHAPWSMTKALLVLGGATALVAVVSEILVGSVEHAAEALGMTSVFVGVIVVAIVGNAAEHSTAVLMALKNQMDLSLSIAIGSSLQIALFVAPVLVMASYFVAPQPMDLVFSPAEVLAVVLAVFITYQIAADGESNWLEGALLLAVYLILAIVFFFLPEVEVAGAH